MGAQHGLSDQPDKIVAFDEIAVLVVEEAAVEVAVPGEAEIGAVFDDGAAGAFAPFRQKRVRDAVGQRRVGRVVDLDEFERQVFLEQVDDRPGAAVAGVADDLERLQVQPFDLFQEPLHIGVLAEQRRQHPALGVVADDREFALRIDKILERFERIVARGGACAVQHHLDAVVVPRIVAGRHHEPGIGTAVVGVEIDLLRPALAERQDIDTAVEQPLRDRKCERRAVLPHVVADNHAAARLLGGDGMPETVGERHVDLSGDFAANVIGFEG